MDKTAFDLAVEAALEKIAKVVGLDGARTKALGRAASAILGARAGAPTGAIIGGALGGVTSEKGERLKGTLRGAAAGGALGAAGGAARGAAISGRRAHAAGRMAQQAAAAKSSRAARIEAGKGTAANPGLRNRAFDKVDAGSVIEDARDLAHAGGAVGGVFGRKKKQKQKKD